MSVPEYINVAKAQIPAKTVAINVARHVKDLVLLDSVMYKLARLKVYEDLKIVQEIVNASESKQVETIFNQLSTFFNTLLYDSDKKNFLEILRAMLSRTPCLSGAKYDKRFMVQLEGPKDQVLLLKEKNWGPGEGFAAEASEIFKRISSTVSATYVLPTNWYVEVACTNFLYNNDVDNFHKEASFLLSNSANSAMKGINLI